MNGVAFHPEAQAELRDAARYYERQRSGLGKAFRLSIEAGLEAIAKAPLRYAVWQSTKVRFAVVRRFPYTIYFVTSDPESILIIAVAHTKQRPAYWQDRLP